MMLREQWFPSADDKAIVVGRFIDVETVNAAKSREENREVKMLRTALESKVAGSHDVSCQLVKPFNESQLKKRFPQAWAHYEAQKRRPPEEIEAERNAPIILGADTVGTALHKADFLGRAQMEKLAVQGFSTIEQLADMSDTQCQNIGHGAVTWRKKAQEFLRRT